MTPYPSLSRQPSRLLAQLALVVSYAVGCLTLVSLLSFGLAVLHGCFHRNGRVDRAQLDIKNIQLALKLYRQHQGRYPSTEEGLRALVQAQALESLPRDPWNFEYHYALRGGAPQIWSLGADGAPGGEGRDADIFSRPPPP
ncbi:type II secretion system protein GspG [Hyalangium rubrum]|uniref:Type II secretion system protein GspG n=1 Tax=Hyalangium rubrum TaxID=3103134 RepID=A0ABU5GZ61_9BACT|nr:type II secretion system protein GspG [Hyalangium sp. s54d21]MDY7225989.1 type II secretion system protein GspG [Hyalangium sp. s54d21]